VANKDGAWKVTRVISYNHNQGLLAKYADLSTQRVFCAPDNFGSKGVVFLLSLF